MYTLRSLVLSTAAALAIIATSIAPSFAHSGGPSLTPVLTTNEFSPKALIVQLKSEDQTKFEFQLGTSAIGYTSLAPSHTVAIYASDVSGLGGAGTTITFQSGASSVYTFTISKNETVVLTSAAGFGGLGTSTVIGLNPATNATGLNLLVYSAGESQSK